MTVRKRVSLWLFSFSILIILLVSIYMKSDQEFSPTPKKSIIVDAYASLPQRLDTALVRSAAEYRILLHLVRPLLKYNKNAQLESDLAVSWNIDDDFRKYSFKIDPNAKWSNGTKISSEQVAWSVLRQIRLSNATHFNFSNIDSVNYTSDELVITLKNRNPHFLKSVAHPEFSPIWNPEEDAMQIDDHRISSGPYFLDTHVTSTYLLKKNQYYTSSNALAPHEILFQSSSFAEQMVLLEQGKVDFIVPSAGVSGENHNRLKSNPNIIAITPHVGYSYWLSLNPQSKAFSSLAARRWFLNFIYKTKLDFSNLSQFWIRADQIYLPDGFGRPNQTLIEATWEKIESGAATKAPSELKLVFSKSFPWTDQIVKELNKLNINVVVETYASANEFEEISKSGKFDAILVNNDFSDAHLVENLLVTFNEARPLIFTGKDRKFQNQLALATETSDEAESVQISIKIGVELLEDALVAPIAYNRKSFYSRANIDVSNWSQLQSDLCFWKIAIH